MCVMVYLFGNFQIHRDDQIDNGWNSLKVQELFVYLLLRRGRPHSRQVLASVLWPERTAEQSMKYLRHALWQLQTALDCDVLQVHAEYLYLNPEGGLWVDVMEFERACAQVQDIPGEDLDERGLEAVKEAIQLYRADLLEDWYQDWCLFERERLQRIYLALLEKHMAYCEAHGEYEVGLECGTCALRYDAAHERIHRRLMRLHYRAGDRTAALRQYERCVALLREELDVEPAERTVTLYKQIRSGQLLDRNRILGNDKGTSSQDIPATPAQALYHLKQLQMTFNEVEHQLQKVIQIVDAVSNGRK